MREFSNRTPGVDDMRREFEKATENRTEQYRKPKNSE